MFGYITPLPDELKVKEYALFRAYYCGLCRTLGKRAKLCAHLNFDCVFLYILADSIKGDENAPLGNCRCVMGGFKRPAMYGEGAAFAAAINAMMAHFKAEDDIVDKSRLYGIRELWLRRAKGKAAAEYPEIASFAQDAALRMRKNELSNEGSVDAAADPYAHLFGEITANIDPYQRTVLYELGYNLGRWVYLIDAWDDIEEDIKKHNYNVFVNKYGLVAAPGADIINAASRTFYYTLSMAADALYTLALKKNAPLLKNIVALGLKNTTKSVLERTEDGSLPRFRRRSKRNG